MPLTDMTLIMGWLVGELIEVEVCKRPYLLFRGEGQ